MKYSLAKVIVSMLLVVSWAVLPQFSFVGYEITGDGALLGHLLYPLSHANVFHLLANILCLWMIPCELHLLSAYMVAVVCSFAPCLLSEATMGFSGVLFAIVGMSWGRVRRFRCMIWRNKWFLAIPIFIPHVNAFLHVYCMLAGWLVGHCFDKATHKTDWL